VEFQFHQEFYDREPDLTLSLKERYIKGVEFQKFVKDSLARSGYLEGSYIPPPANSQASITKSFNALARKHTLRPISPS